MAFTRINIAVKPSQEVTAEAIKLSRKISKNAEAYFVLDELNFLPHITIYSPEYPNKNLKKILNAVGEVTFSLKPFTATFNFFDSHLGYIDMVLQKTKSWERLHELIVKKLNSYREDHIREKFKSPTELVNYTPIQQKHILKYGYPEIFTTFRPHLTIIQLKNSSPAKEIVRNLNFPVQSFQITKIAAYLMGNHGTCTKIVREYSLK